MSRTLLAASIVALLLAGCDDRPRQWDAFIYHDSNMVKFDRINGFKTFELCRQAALDRIESLPQPEEAGFECGYKCEVRADYGGLNVCEETRD